jgi:transposase
MNNKAYSGRNVNQVQLDTFLKDRRDRDGQDLWVGVDVGKERMSAVLNWGPGQFERPWMVDNPGGIRLLAEHFKRLAVGRRMIVAMEPSGTYGDVLRQACGDAGVAVHRVSPKAAHDYAEVFDGVPSQHDGKDAAVVAELARLGKSAAWPWVVPPEPHQRIEYWVDRMDASRRLQQMWCGRIEARLARHWPELPRQLKLTSPTLLGVLAEYAGPAALAADPQAAAKLTRWSRNHLSDRKVARVIDGAKHSVGVRQTPVDVLRLRDYAAEAADARRQVKQARQRLLELSRDVEPIRALAAAVGNATACVLFTYLGDPHNYHCAAAYVKAMGLNLVERSSGMYQGKLKISKRGSGAVRYWMYLAAIRLVKQTSPVRPWYLKKKHRDSDEAGRALVGVMRRLGLALYHVAARGEAFDARRLFPGKRRGAGPRGAGPKDGRRATARGTGATGKGG